MYAFIPKGTRVSFNGELGTVVTVSDTNWQTASVEFDNDKGCIVQKDKRDLTLVREDEEYYVEDDRIKVREQIKTGDRVQVIADGNPYRGMSGVVEGPWYLDTRAIMVDLYGYGNQAFYAHQLKVLVTVESQEDAEIHKIAKVVQEASKDHDDPFTEAQAFGFARRLYEGGLRKSK